MAVYYYITYVRWSSCCRALRKHTACFLSFMVLEVGNLHISKRRPSYYCGEPASAYQPARGQHRRN